MTAGFFAAIAGFLWVCIKLIIEYLPTILIIAVSFECLDNKIVIASIIVYLIIFVLTHPKVLQKFFKFEKFLAYWLSIAYQWLGLCLINGIERVTRGLSFIYMDDGDKQDLILTVVFGALTVVPLIVQIIIKLIKRPVSNENTPRKGNFKRPESYFGELPYIFISYAHKDINNVMEVIEKLGMEGYRVWYDEGIDPGTEWSDNIAQHIIGSTLFIAFISENYLGSKNCKDELGYSIDVVENRLLIYLEDVELDEGAKMRNSRYQSIYMNKYFGFGMDKFYQKLFETKGISECKSIKEKS